MKKLILTLGAALFTMMGAMAVPASPKSAKITQSDGSTITLRLYGDEFYAWVETSDGYNVVQREDGFFYYDAPNSPARVRAKDPSQRGAADRSILSQTRRGMPTEGIAVIQVAMNRYARAAQNKRSGGMLRAPRRASSDGKFHSLVVLVNFSDRVFAISSPQTSFSNLLNQDGYSANNATGSAWNYYYDNSNGQFDGSFDVVGPITLDQKYSYYGANKTVGNTTLIDVNYVAFLPDVVAALGSQASVNWSQYVSSGMDVHPIFIFYAGYNEAEGQGNNANTIWPHMSPIDNVIATTTGGYTIRSYACTSELRGYSGATMAGIGTFCHEFGHVIGLPDFYDTDRSNNSSALTPHQFSLMAQGPYNNDGRTPPSMMAIERILLGWTEPIPLYLSENVNLEHISTGNSYIIMTTTANEWFLLETRGSTNKWDSYIFNGTWGGLLVTHIDRSPIYSWYWDYNVVNASSAHPCMIPVRAYTTSSSTTSDTAEKDWLFPVGGKTSLNSSTYSSFKAWNGASIDGALTNITYNSATGVSSFTYTTSATELPVMPTSVSVTPTSTAIDMNQEIQLTANILPNNATVKNVTWTSSDDTKATVSQAGVVRGILAGSATITATAVNGLTATCAVTIRQAATSINISPFSVKVEVGKEFQLTATVLPENAFNKELEWSSNNTQIATVSADGVVTGVAVGTATVTAKVVGTSVQSVCSINVLNEIGDIAIESILQNDAILTWDYDNGTKFKVELSKGGEVVKVFDVSEKYIYMPSLLANTEYDVAIYPVDSSGTQIGTIKKKATLQTLENTAEFPAMGLMSSTFTTAQQVPLRAKNLPQNVASVDWYVDNKKATAPSVTLTEGEHKLELVVTTEDDDVEIVTRWITVTK